MTRPVLIVLFCALGCGGAGDEPTQPRPTTPPPSDPSIAASLKWEYRVQGGCREYPHEIYSVPDSLVSCAASAIERQSRLAAVLANYPQCRITQTTSTAQIDCSGLCSSAQKNCGSGVFIATYTCPASPQGASSTSCAWTPP